jgi:hypothetical protein
LERGGGGGKGGLNLRKNLYMTAKRQHQQLLFIHFPEKNELNPVLQDIFCQFKQLLNRPLNLQFSEKMSTVFQYIL